MQTKEVRGAKILLPSEDEPPVSFWPFGTPLEDEKINNTEFRGVDLSTHRWEKVILSRVVFTGSRMMGHTVEDLTLSDVLFEGCQFDYAVFNKLRVKESVAFINCRFREAVFSGGDIGGAVFDDCAFQGTEFDSVRMKNTDIRGSEISGISGIVSLKGAKVSEAQLPNLFDSFAEELELKVSED
jgi:uncharacterized protein YjbI with pentapeptide repeats